MSTRCSKYFDLIQKQNKEFFENWIASLKLRNRSPQTIMQYSCAMRIFFSWNYEFNGDKLFIELKNRDFSAFILYVKNELKSCASRINFYRVPLNSLSKFIEKEYEEDFQTFRNKAQNIETITGAPVREKVIITEDQLEEMLNKLVEMKEYQLACWLSFLASSGCRRSEAVQMKVVWFTKEYEHFPEPYTMWKTPPIRTKGRGEEGKVIPKYIFKKSFEKYLNLWLDKRKTLGIANETLFVSKSTSGPLQYFDATCWTANAFAHQISNIFSMRFHNHCMRHFFATYLRHEHFPNDIILKIVKWENEAMIDHYDDSDDDLTLEEYFKNRKD